MKYDRAKMEYRSTKRRITVNVQKLDNDDFAITQNRTITFNSYALRDRNITINNILNGNKFASSDVEDIAAHEYGHIIASMKGNKGIELAQKAYYNVFKDNIGIDEILVFLNDNISMYSIEYDNVVDIAKGKFDAKNT